jgi:hypothetical protein
MAASSHPTSSGTARRWPVSRRKGAPSTVGGNKEARTVAGGLSLALCRAVCSPRPQHTWVQLREWLAERSVAAACREMAKRQLGCLLVAGKFSDWDSNVGVGESVWLEAAQEVASPTARHDHQPPFHYVHSISPVRQAQFHKLHALTAHALLRFAHQTS